MLDIVSRLPAESVLECKLVCKRWRDLVRDPSLAQMHLNHLNDSSGKLSCIFFTYDLGIIEFYYSEYDENCHDEAPFHRTTRLNLKPPFLDYSFVGSCNGLICFNAWVEQKIGVWSYGPAYICNPITSEYIILPKIDQQFRWTGFGYIPETNEYKVVRIYIPEKRLDGEAIGIGVVQVYTLGSTACGWRNVGTTDINMQRFSYCAAVFANGALYWEEHHGTTILGFHLADEKIIQLPAPPPYLTRTNASYFSIKFGVLGDLLSVTHEDGGDCDIWLLKKNEDNDDFNWIKQFSLNGEISRPFEFTKSGRLLCYGNSRIYYSYDPKVSSAKIDISFGKSICEAIPHKNTLVSLKELGENDTKTIEFVEIISSSEETVNGD
ncbi:F-box/kelch-repeat protein At3g23880-like [Papaver somniferum]|uniref:F-box/kelch-repeat protein At3g23880-like n=1 Tax=Papaver somniferum TaxID=3469 RepID=UPI000E70298E|nr:F-box/kelch-repeat protein At3g23880-like [Papaver somniferum]